MTQNLVVTGRHHLSERLTLQDWSLMFAGVSLCQAGQELPSDLPLSWRSDLMHKCSSYVIYAATFIQLP